MEKGNETPVSPSPEAVSSPEPTQPKPKLSRKKLIAIISAIVAFVGITTATCIVIAAQSNNPALPTTDGPTSLAPATPDAELDFKFLRLENEEGKNIIYSPLSIKYALAMLQAGADGNSKTQIDNILGENIQFKEYSNSEKQSLANVLFVRDTKKDQILDSYTQTIQKYGASVVYDPFSSAKPFNNWISDNTLGLIDKLFNDDDIEAADFIITNALGINMYWTNKIQCSQTTGGPDCKNREGYPYSVKYAHEDYSHYIPLIGGGSGASFKKIDFNGKQVEAAEIGASINNYNIVEELGEDHIRSTVLDAYKEYLKTVSEELRNLYPEDYPDEYDIDKYMNELKENYGRVDGSTDFYFLDTETEKVFAKDLQTTSTSSLRYVGIMPKSGSLSSYIDTITTSKILGIISDLRDPSKTSNFKQGVVTKITGYVPFFDFEYELKLRDDLKTLGVTDIFSLGVADLTKLANSREAYIQDAKHKANIEFTNDGIKAAAATAFVGGIGAAGPFDYLWDVPVEEIDLTFDQPFMFIIYDKDSGDIWFTGAVYDI